MGGWFIRREWVLFVGDVDDPAAPVGEGAGGEGPFDFAFEGDTEAVTELVVGEASGPGGGDESAVDIAGAGGGDAGDEAVGGEVEVEGGGDGTVAEGGAGCGVAQGLPFDAVAGAEGGRVPGGFCEVAEELAFGERLAG